MLPQYDFRLMMFCGNDLRRKINVSSTHPKHELGSFEPYRVQIISPLLILTCDEKLWIPSSDPEWIPLMDTFF